jgi:hypothetical protein
MSKAATITIINQGAGVGPFNLYALNASGDVIQTIELNVPLSSLTAGYNVYNLLNATAAIKIDSNNTLCGTSKTISIPTQNPPACNCITIENPLISTITYSYVNCDGDDVGPLSLLGPAAIQVCGSNATASESYVVITEGSACNAGECTNGTLVVQNYTSNTVNITNITPKRFYSFSTPAEFPDNPVIIFPIVSGNNVTATRIKYNLPITVTVSSDGQLNITLQLFRNNVLMETKNQNFIVGSNTVVFNSLSIYTFNTTDELKIVMIDGIN